MKKIFILILVFFIFLASLNANNSAVGNTNESLQSHCLTIDKVWEWNTFMGSWHADHGKDITVDGDGSETIDGAATNVISADYGKVTVYSDGVSAWYTK